ncbi:hypothetical protein BD413DRAFT_593807 [Trametes elegans]|nr:hypothetical protein BD413DRAFT_593807 [Trametes elegans]
MVSPREGFIACKVSGLPQPGRLCEQGQVQRRSTDRRLKLCTSAISDSAELSILFLWASVLDGKGAFSIKDPIHSYRYLGIVSENSMRKPRPSDLSMSHWILRPKRDPGAYSVPPMTPPAWITAGRAIYRRPQPRDHPDRTNIHPSSLLTLLPARRMTLRHAQQRVRTLWSARLARGRTSVTWAASPANTRLRACHAHVGACARWG